MLFKLSFLILAVAVFFVPAEGHCAHRKNCRQRTARAPPKCTLNDGAEGFCVMSYLCQNGTINVDGDDVLDERRLDCEAPSVCCLLQDEETTTLSSTTSTTRKPRTASTLVPHTTPPTGPGQRCTAYDDSPGRCLYPHLCKNDSSVIDGGDDLDERTSSGLCPSWRGAIQVCCPEAFLPDDIDDDDDTTTTTSTTPQSTTTKSTTTSSTTTPSTTTQISREDVECFTEYSEKGICVPFYQCTEEAGDSAAGEIDVRFSTPIACPYQTCCPIDKVDRNKKPPIPEPPKRCGISNKDGLIYKKYRGQTNEAKFGEFPWMLAVRTRTGPGVNDYNTTGGSLIHPSVALTAAHYVVRALYGDVRIRAGEWDTFTEDEPLKYQERAISKIAAHPEFKNRNKHNDIALLFVREPFVLAPHVGLVCLPPAERVAPSTECIANGWGKDKFGSKGKLQNILKKLILPAVDHRDCQTSLRNTRLGPFFRLFSGFMCAGGQKSDTCTQDGGGPLACTLENEPDRYRVWGVVSWGIGCGEDGVPGVYVDVSRYGPWMRELAHSEGHNLDEYDV